MDWFLYDNGPRHERVIKAHKMSFTGHITLISWILWKNNEKSWQEDKFCDLTNCRSMLHFYPPEDVKKPNVSWRFHGVQKWNIWWKWINKGWKLQTNGHWSAELSNNLDYAPLSFISRQIFIDLQHFQDAVHLIYFC